MQPTKVWSESDRRRNHPLVAARPSPFETSPNFLAAKDMVEASRLDRNKSKSGEDKRALADARDLPPPASPAQSKSQPQAFGRAFGIFMSFGHVARVVLPTLFSALYNVDPSLLFVGMACMVGLEAGCVQGRLRMSFMLVGRGISCGRSTLSRPRAGASRSIQSGGRGRACARRPADALSDFGSGESCRGGEVSRPRVRPWERGATDWRSSQQSRHRWHRYWCKSDPWAPTSVRHSAGALFRIAAASGRPSAADLQRTPLQVRSSCGALGIGFSPAPPRPWSKSEHWSPISRPKFRRTPAPDLAPALPARLSVAVTP